MQGSPPLTRGKVTQQYDGLDKKRITPAYAGKRYSKRKKQVQTGDHPRLRGEKSSSVSSVGWKLGSPPLTRGKAWDGDYGLRNPRITPAYAGKSSR